MKRTPMEVRFAKYICDPDENGCVLWVGATNGKGYGTLSRDHLGNKVAAHRAAWEFSNGPIPDGLMVLHRCDVRNCVNVEHLFLGTNYDNCADMAAKGRGTTGAAGLPCGVYRNKKRFGTQVKIAGKNLHFGTFDSIDGAAAAAMAAKAQLRGIGA